MFRLPGRYPHQELLEDAERTRRRAEAGARRRQGVLDVLERDQHALRDTVTALMERFVGDRDGGKEGS